MTRVYVSIGSNVDRERHVRAAMQALREMFSPVQFSPVYETAAVGFEGDAFFNLVAGFDTDWTVAQLAHWLRALEAAHGRVRGDAKFSDRTLDVDLLVYGDACGVVDGVALPRDETTHYAFVLKPLTDIDPGLVLPGQQDSCHVLWQRHPEHQVTMHEVSLG
ncbi:MAG: 2-amino-4-hydroxy-6-hydroxymethyldihydropteridine diphosphokinase [Gammaproteobacteria bacterium]|nr:MAG: 2-amino-4-hydroxy-6-hydroxymethyldihydropteridine diphosphokinase [Gammaproteobacteria bacterium]